MNIATKNYTIHEATVTLSREEVDAALLAAITGSHPEIKITHGMTFRYEIAASAAIDDLDVKGVEVNLMWQTAPDPQLESFPAPVRPATPAVQRAAEQAAVFESQPVLDTTKSDVLLASPVVEAKIATPIANGGLALAIAPRTTDGGWAYSFHIRYAAKAADQSKVDWVGNLPSKEAAEHQAIKDIREIMKLSRPPETTAEKKGFNNAKQALDARQKKLDKAAPEITAPRHVPDVPYDDAADRERRGFWTDAPVAEVVA